MMEDELLCDAWLSVSANFLGRKQAGTSFWQSIHYLFHEQKHNRNFYLHMIHDHNAKSLVHLRYAIFNFINKYHCVVYQVINMMLPSTPTTKIVTFCSFL